MQDQPTELSTAPEAWREFCLRYPCFGHKGEKHDYVHFMRTHKPALIAAGALVLTHRRRWLATGKFNEAALSVLTRTPETA